MIDGSQKRNRRLAFELQNSHVCEKRGNCKTWLSKEYDRENFRVHFTRQFKNN